MQKSVKAMAKEISTRQDASTEEKIKEAARKVFTRKGYAATRTRDIAEEAGINLALLNYYFRSKEKLFGQVMMEKMQQFFGLLFPIMNDASTKLEVKIELIVFSYIDMLSANPDLPLFVLSEMRLHAEQIGKLLQAGEINADMSFIKQLEQKNPDIDPLHFFMNILGMTVFPFIAKPAFRLIGFTDKHKLEIIMKERKKLIPMWTKAMLKAK